MKSLNEIEFGKEYLIKNVKYLTPEEEVHLAGEGIVVGSHVNKVVKTAFGDFVECIVEDRLIGIPLELCKRIYVELQ